MQNYKQYKEFVLSYAVPWPGCLARVSRAPSFAASIPDLATFVYPRMSAGLESLDKTLASDTTVDAETAVSAIKTSAQYAPQLNVMLSHDVPVIVRQYSGRL